MLSRDPPVELELEMRFLRGEALLEEDRHAEARQAYAAVWPRWGRRVLPTPAARTPARTSLTPQHGP